jgi:flagellar biosynthesis protein FlhA
MSKGSSGSAATASLKNLAPAQKPLGAKRVTEAGAAIATVAIVLMLVVPLPHWLLDFLLVLNITLALGVLMLTFYVKRALDFSAFPSLLLLVTLLRLALNVSATRLILGTADAGAVIAAFGTFVIGGNFVVGIVVFIVLVVIQFVVITSGAGRVAEVAARFTLDAMPGKQMAIDAELNAGVIDEATARARRAEVAREADFYGAMDGASKFTRGDTIAAVVMIIVNILGGFAVGVLQRGMDLAAALQTYTLLTVGEGLVTQIPALLVSAASGLIVTRPGSHGADGAGNLGHELAAQIVSSPQALTMTAGVLGALALVPGLPKLPFLAAAVGLGWYSTHLSRRLRARPARAPAPPSPPENMVDLLPVDPLEVQLGYGLVCLADPKQGGDLLERITAVRRQIATEMGFVVPPIRVRDNVRLRGNQYLIRLRGVEIGGGELLPDHLLAMDAGAVSQSLPGIPAVDPAFGLPAIWVPAAQRTLAEVSGYTVADPTNVLVTHLSELVRRHAPEILTRQDVQTLLDAVRQHSPAVVEELVPQKLTLGQVQKALQSLLAERVCIRDLVTILEALADGAQLTTDPEFLTEGVRARLARTLTQQYAERLPVAADRPPSDGSRPSASRLPATDAESRGDAGDGGRLYCFTVHPTMEQTIVDSLRRTDQGTQLVLDPTIHQRIVDGVRRESERMVSLGHQPLVLCAPRIRPVLRQLVERAVPTLVALSYVEVAPGVAVESVGMVSLE